MIITQIELEFVELPDVPGDNVRFVPNSGLTLQPTYLLSMWDCSCKLATWNRDAQRFEEAGRAVRAAAVRSWAVLPRPVDWPGWGDSVVDAALAMDGSRPDAGWLEPHHEDAAALKACAGVAEAVGEGR